MASKSILLSVTVLLCIFLMSNIGFAEVGSEEEKTETVEARAPQKKELSHVEEVLSDYTGYIVIVKSQMFKDYVNNLPVEKSETEKRILEFGEREEVVRLVSDYLKQEDSQREHIQLITTLVKNYTGMNRQIRAERTIQDWMEKVEDNAVVKDLKIREINNKSTFDTYTYLVCYTIVRNSTEKEYSFLVDTSGESVRSIWMNRDIRKTYHLKK